MMTRVLDIVIVERSCDAHAHQHKSIHVLIKTGFDSFQFSTMEYGVTNYYWKEVFVSFAFLIQTTVTLKLKILYL